MGICTSTKKNREIKVNQNKHPKNEYENKKNDKLNESKESNDENKEKNEEENSVIKNEEEEKNKKNDDDKSSLLSGDSENSEDEEKNKNKNKKKQNQIDDDDKVKEIIINYTTNGKTEFKETFKSTDKISSLFDILLLKKSKYSQYDLTTNEYLSLSSKLNEKIGEIFKDTENAEVNMLYLGLDISEDIKTEYENTNTVIGMPLFDLGQNVGLLIFHKIEKKFSTEILKDKKLSKFNHLSSICNGKNILYLSGGDETTKHGKNKTSNHFCSIDLLSPKSVNSLPVLNIARSWHSMIYIPKKYIYIIGGGTKDTELYDIEKKSLIIDKQMNEVRNESTLFVMNNSILYAFCGISAEGTFISTVERSNLRQKERTWSYVNYSTADNTLFEECFYIGTMFSDTSLILFAANEDEKNDFPNILFDLEDEDNPTLSYYESGEKIIDIVPEKVFHPIGHNISILIPLVGTKAKIYKIDEALKLNIEYFPDALKSIME